MIENDRKNGDEAVDFGISYLPTKPFLSTEKKLWSFAWGIMEFGWCHCCEDPWLVTPILRDLQIQTSSITVDGHVCRKHGSSIIFTSTWSCIVGIQQTPPKGLGVTPQRIDGWNSPLSLVVVAHYPRWICWIPVNTKEIPIIIFHYIFIFQVYEISMILPWYSHTFH